MHLFGRARRPGRAPLVVLVVVAVVGVVLVAMSAMQGTLTYYRTPSELLSDPPAQAVRVGGLVVAGTVIHHGATVRFVLTDGAHDVTVVTDGAPPATFRAGQGAVVEGHLLTGGLFRADQVIVRHSNQYRPPPMQHPARTGAGGTP